MYSERREEFGQPAAADNSGGVVSPRAGGVLADARKLRLSVVTAGGTHRRLTGLAILDKHTHCVNSAREMWSNDRASRPTTRTGTYL